jgi:hypothetical protein
VCVYTESQGVKHRQACNKEVDAPSEAAQPLLRSMRTVIHLSSSGNRTQGVLSCNGLAAMARGPALSSAAQVSPWPYLA